jgi:sensor histidine kinase YesM
MNILKINREDFIKILVEKRWIWHATFWATYLILESPTYFFQKHQPADVWKLTLMQTISLISITYLIIFVCFPLFYNKKKYLLFIISLIINASLINFIFNHLVNEKINEFLAQVSNLPRITLLESFVQGISITILFSIFIVIAKLGRQAFVKQYYDNENKKFQMQSELENLKAQLSPHFLFNTMNNFYGLAVDKSNKLPDLMLRLSDLMRYSLYETKKAMVLLDNEIEYLKNYIELEKIRLEDSLQLEFNYNDKMSHEFEIAPLILIVFVENAFKHSRNSIGKIIKIDIDLKILPNNWMHFTIQNNFDENKTNQINLVGGIGVKNVKKRLEAIYPNLQHSLNFNTNNGGFTVELKLRLNRKINSNAA